MFFRKILSLSLLVALFASNADCVETFRVAVNFQDAEHPQQAGYLRDSGEVFGDRGNGYSYGWATPNSVESAVSGSDLTDYVRQTACPMDTAGGATWELLVPNGVYAVKALLGLDTMSGVANELRVEGHYVPNFTPETALTTSEVIVSVSDGRISFSAFGGTAYLAALEVSQTEAMVASHGVANDGQRHGLVGGWYDNTEFMDLARVSLDPSIRYYWGGKEPWPGMRGELWNAKWQGGLVSEVTGTHNLCFRFNESCRVYINGENEPIVDAWYRGKTWYSEYVDVDFVAGEPLPIVVEYRQRFRSSGIRVLWKPSPGALPDQRETAYTHINTECYLPPADTMAPTTPSGVLVHYQDAGPAQVSWAGSEDNCQLWFYRIRRDGEAIGTSMTQVFVDSSASQDQGHIYTVEAVDWDGNTSGVSVEAETWRGVDFNAPSESLTSPMWVEGTVGASTVQVELSVDSGPGIPAIRLGDELWGADIEAGGALGVPLSKDGPTSLTATAIGAGGQQASDSIALTWLPTVIGEGPDQEVVIRSGDSLLLKVDANAGDSICLDVDNDGSADFWGDNESQLEHLFDAPGIYTVVAGVDENADGVFDAYGELVGSLVVKVIDVNFDGPVACRVGYRREKGVEVFPLSEADIPVWEANDQGLLEVSVIADEELSQEVLDNPEYNPFNYGKRLYLRPIVRGTPVLLARTPGGAVIRYQEVDEFTLDTPTVDGLIVNASDRIAGGSYVMRPHIGGLMVSFDMFSHSSTFAGGETHMELNTNDMSVVGDSETGENVGVFQFDIEVPEGEDSFCFRVNMDQESAHGTTVTGSIGTNGDTCEISIDSIDLAQGGQRGDLIVVHTNHGTSHPNHIGGHNRTINITGVPANPPEGTGTAPTFEGAGGDTPRMAPNNYDCHNEYTTNTVRSGTEPGAYSVTIGDTVFPGVINVVAYEYTELAVGGSKDRAGNSIVGFAPTRVDQSSGLDRVNWKIQISNAVPDSVHQWRIYLEAAPSIKAEGQQGTNRTNPVMVSSPGNSMQVPLVITGAIANGVSSAVIVEVRPVDDGDWINVGGTTVTTDNNAVRLARVLQAEDSDIPDGVTAVANVMSNRLKWVPALSGTLGDYSASGLHIPAPVDGGHSESRMWDMANQPTTFEGSENPTPYTETKQGPRDIARDALDDTLPDITGGALHFFGPGAGRIQDILETLEADGHAVSVGQIGGNTYYAPSASTLAAQAALP